MIQEEYNLLLPNTAMQTTPSVTFDSIEQLESYIGYKFDSDDITQLVEAGVLAKAKLRVEEAKHLLQLSGIKVDE